MAIDAGDTIAILEDLFTARGIAGICVSEIQIGLWRGTVDVNGVKASALGPRIIAVNALQFGNGSGRKRFDFGFDERPGFVANRGQSFARGGAKVHAPFAEG